MSSPITGSSSAQSSTAPFHDVNESSTSVSEFDTLARRRQYSVQRAHGHVLDLHERDANTRYSSNSTSTMRRFSTSKIIRPDSDTMIMKHKHNVLLRASEDDRMTTSLQRKNWGKTSTAAWSSLFYLLITAFCTPFYVLAQQALGQQPEVDKDQLDPHIHTPKRRHEKVKWIELVHHTFPEGNLTDHALALWHLESAANPVNDYVQLFPDVVQRYGQIWNKEAITTDHFELSFRLDVFAKNRIPETTGAGLGVWLTTSNVNEYLRGQTIVGIRPENLDAASEWNEGVKDLGFDFLGHNVKLPGFGVVFTLEDRHGNIRPSVNCLRTPAHTFEKLEYGKNFPEDGKGVRVDFRNQPLDVRIHVKKTVITAEYKLPASQSRDWAHLCTVSDVPKAGRTFMGWAGWTGSPKEPGNTSGDLIAKVSKVKTWNFNLNNWGSEMSGVAEDIRKMYTELYKKNFQFKNQREQTEAIHGILKMLKSYIVQSHEAEGQQARTLLHVKSQMLDMEASANKLRKEVHFVLENVNEDHSPEGRAKRKQKAIEEMRREVGSIRTVISDMESDTNRFAEVSDSVAAVAVRGGEDSAVDDVAQQTEDIKSLAETQMYYATLMNMVVISTLIILVAIIGSKIMYYEKKHLL
ncbi:unnamed protein product [Amoebophrya sp. A25]|nr:unnamed protein product [Amoebophrya sp. A25]|eukprot:GSA25T00000977001.1